MLRAARIGLAMCVAFVGFVEAFAEVRWTYENGVLTEIESATSGSTLWAFNLSNAGVLTKKTAGNGAQLDFRKAAMPEGAPDIVQFSGRGLFTEYGTALKELFMPETLTTIGSEYPFIRCYGLTNLVWSANITYINEWAFRECTALKSEVVIPPAMTAIAYDSFNNCSAVGSLRLHDKLTSICGYAFNEWNGLTNVVGGLVPRSVTSLGNAAFNCCYNLATPFEYGFATNAAGEYVSVSLADSCAVLTKCRKVPSIRLGPGFTRYPYHLITEPYGLKYVEMDANISECWETFVDAPLTNVVIKYEGTFAFPESAGSRSSPYNTFKSVTSLKEIWFGGWFSYAANATYNPFSGWTDLQARFVVDGSNATCQAFCADTTKLTPWRKVPVADQVAYFQRYGEDAKVPCGVTVAVANGLPRTYIVRRGDFDKDLPKYIYPFDDTCVRSLDASIVTNEVDGRYVYSVTSTASTVALIVKQDLTLEEMLVVGGGGAGAGLKGGGGGGGGVIYDTNRKFVLAGSTITVSVGKGATGTTTRSTAAKGGATSVTVGDAETVAYGGGGGGSDGYSNWHPSQGGQIGSGGGMGAGGNISHLDGDDYTASQGKPGGNSNGGGVGGGGGWSGPGGNGASGRSGNGGEGMTNAITGVRQVYGSGGGGGTGNPNSGTVTVQALGGTNAGNGAPYVKDAAGGDAPAGFGGGGGGGGRHSSTTSRGGHGGSGCVILSFSVGGKAGQPEITPNDITITFPDGATQPYIAVHCGGDSKAAYSATVTVYSGFGAAAAAGMAYASTNVYTGVANGDTVAGFAFVYPPADETVYVKVVASADGVPDAVAEKTAVATGSVPSHVGKGGGAHVIHVRTGARGRNDGTSWSDAYTDLRPALKLLNADHDELWFAGDESVNIAMSEAIAPSVAAAIRGGFTGVENKPSERPSESRSRIHPNEQYDGFKINNARPLTVDGFLFTKGQSHGLTKGGAGNITVTNCVFDGNGTAQDAISGRGLYISGSTASTTATVAGCTFLRHYENFVNAAMGTLALNALARAIVTDCLVASNGLGGITSSPFVSHNGRDGGWGAALAAQNAPVTVERCVFSGNIGNSMYINGNLGGGIVMLRGNCNGSVFRNCAWIGNNSLYTKESSTNYTDPEGGALVVRMNNAAQVARVENCTFAWNFYSGSNATAGVNVRAGTVAITNTICWGNACGTQKCRRPADLYVQNGARALVGYSRFSAPEECVADAGATLTLGPGVTYGDPLFVTSTNDLAACRSFGKTIAFKAAAGAAISDFNAHLRGSKGYFDEKTGTLEKFRREKSPAIDAGDPASDYTREPDVQGVGSNGRRVNLGCWGNTPWATMSPVHGAVFYLR